MNQQKRTPPCRTTIVIKADRQEDFYFCINKILSPGSLLRLQRAYLTESENMISDHRSGADAEAGVSAPEFAVTPVVSASGSNSIDPCLELLLEALVDNPRALTFAWSCKNVMTWTSFSGPYRAT
jgi:hypothetical protein